MSGFRVWRAGENEAHAAHSDAANAAEAANEIAHDLIADGVAAILGQGASFDLLVRDGAGRVARFRGQAPPVFALDDVECCAVCGVSGDDEGVAWAGDDLCAVCAESAP